MNPDAWLTGRRGQGLAVAIGVLLMALVWFGVVDPVWSWYEDRDLLLEQRQGLLRHMQDLAASLPSLRAASAAKPGLGEGLGDDNAAGRDRCGRCCRPARTHSANGIFGGGQPNRG